MAGLPEALSLTSLVAGTLEYAILVRHRRERRQGAEAQATVEAFGHDALVRMRLLPPRRQRAWSGLGTRFR